MSNAKQSAESTPLSTEIGRPSQCRRDALSGRWVIFAPGRGKRPAEIIETELPLTSGVECPFCAGNEQSTPPATLLFPDHSCSTHSWAVRVIPNLFPAVLPEEVIEQNLGGRRLYPNHLETDKTPRLRVPFSDTQHLSDAQLSHDSQHRSNWPQLEELPPASQHSRPSRRAKDSQSQSIELFEAYELHGGHEVIVETPHHVESLTQLSAEHVAQVFFAYASRMRYWFEVPGIEYVVTFKNMGAAAGASLRHTHSQLIATSLLPPAADETGQRMTRYFRDTQACLMCETLAAELAEERRIVCQTESFVAFCPFASRLPYLVRVAPRRHLDRFELESQERLAELALLTQRLVASMEAMFVSCAYNYTIHSRPRHVACDGSYHWWIEIFPRLTKVAGFEWGSDCYINPVTPEVAAAHLRGEPFGQEMDASADDPVDFSD